MILAQIKRLCAENGTTVFALEKLLGFGNGTISAWETSDPGTKRLKAVADHFGVTVDELLKEGA